jgi:hypothetical protein
MEQVPHKKPDSAPNTTAVIITIAIIGLNWGAKTNAIRLIAANADITATGTISLAFGFRLSKSM